MLELSRILHEPGVLLNDNDELRPLVEEYIELIAVGGAYREQRQIDQLSNIAANAVRRHPEKDNITIGVVVGIHHDRVLETLAEGTEIEGVLRRVPADANPLHGVNGSVRMRSTYEGLHELSDEELDRALLGLIVDRALSTQSYESYAHVSELVDNADRLPDDEVRNIMDGIAAIKRELCPDKEALAPGISSEVALRVRELLQNYPAFAGLLAESNDQAHAGT